jgi:hypothetical protein
MSRNYEKKYAWNASEYDDLPHRATWLEKYSIRRTPKPLKTRCVPPNMGMSYFSLRFRLQIRDLLTLSTSL